MRSGNPNLSRHIGMGDPTNTPAMRDPGDMFKLAGGQREAGRMALQPNSMGTGLQRNSLNSQFSSGFANIFKGGNQQGEGSYTTTNGFQTMTDAGIDTGGIQQFIQQLRGRTQARAGSGVGDWRAGTMQPNGYRKVLTPSGDTWWIAPDGTKHISGPSATAWRAGNPTTPKAVAPPAAAPKPPAARPGTPAPSPSGRTTVGTKKPRPYYGYSRS